MASKKSAGILLYKKSPLRFFLVHSGGPFWKNKELGAWSIPKGEFTDEEDALSTAIREFKEETGQIVEGDFIALQPVKQKGGKIIYAWAVEGDADAANITSNNFSMEWPPSSGKFREFPEVDKSEWMSLEDAMQKINPAQAGLIAQLQELINIHH